MAILSISAAYIGVILHGEAGRQYQLGVAEGDIADSLGNLLLLSRVLQKLKICANALIIRFLLLFLRADK